MAKGGERAKYALITALYNDKSRGLYSDIYYPIIKYAVIKISITTIRVSIFLRQSLCRRWYTSISVSQYLMLL